MTAYATWKMSGTIVAMLVRRRGHRDLVDRRAAARQ